MSVIASEKDRTAKRFGALFGGSNAYTWGLVVLGIAVAVGFGIVNPRVYISALNLESMALSVPEIAILALAILRQ